VIKSNGGPPTRRQVDWCFGPVFIGDGSELSERLGCVAQPGSACGSLVRREVELIAFTTLETLPAIGLFPIGRLWGKVGFFYPPYSCE
jgi:hypothetical protein